jgi:hypothetical protein
MTRFFCGADGPGDIFRPLAPQAGEDFPGSRLDCFYCLNVWVGLLFAHCPGDARRFRQRIRAVRQCMEFLENRKP